MRAYCLAGLAKACLWTNLPTYTPHAYLPVPTGEKPETVVWDRVPSQDGQDRGRWMDHPTSHHV